MNTAEIRITWRFAGVGAMVALMALASGAALATEYGTVISSTPVTAQVPVPQQACRNEQRALQPRTSGGGALLGAVVGGVLGNSVGGGVGRAAATGLGVVAGAGIGDQIEANGSAPASQTVTVCQNGTAYENRLVGYDVIYEYNGQRYNARMPQDPGQQIALDVSVAPTGQSRPAQSGTLPPPQAIYAEPPVVYSPPPVYYDPYYRAVPAYGYYPYGPAAVFGPPRVFIGIGGGYGGGYRGHWR